MLLATSSSSSIYICKVPPEWLPWTRRALERIRPSEMVWISCHRIHTCKSPPVKQINPKPCPHRCIQTNTTSKPGFLHLSVYHHCEGGLMRHTLLELPPKEAEAGPSDLSLRASALLTPPNSNWVFNADSHTCTHSYVHNQTKALWLPLPYPLAACILGPSELHPLQNSLLSSACGLLPPEGKLGTRTEAKGRNPSTWTEFRARCLLCGSQETRRVPVDVGQGILLIFPEHGSCCLVKSPQLQL